MTREETSNLLNMVALYRPYYLTNFNNEQKTMLIDEWYNKLQKYELEDVKDNLDKFFKEENTRIPSPYDLTRGIRTIEQKNQKGRTYIFCDVCNAQLEVFIDKETNRIDRFEADKHIERCHSIRYLQQLYKKWWNRGIPKEDIENLKVMDQYHFDNTYYTILKKAYLLMEDGTDEKFLASKVLEGRI